MSNIIKLPQNRRLPKPFPRQRVFYVGYGFTDPYDFQDEQKLYLKRMGKKGNRWWQLLIYDKYKMNDKKNYSIAIESCTDKELPKMLDDWGIDIIFQDLREIGWESEHDKVRTNIVFFSK